MGGQTPSGCTTAKSLLFDQNLSEKYRFPQDESLLR